MSRLVVLFSLAACGGFDRSPSWDAPSSTVQDPAPPPPTETLPETSGGSTSTTSGTDGYLGG